MKNPYVHIKDSNALVANLVEGLRLPSEEIRGEILFVLYKFSILQFASNNDEEYNVLSAFCPKIFRYSLDALMKTQSDSVRMNCVALLLVLAQRGCLLNVYDNNGSGMDSNNAVSFIEEAEDGIDEHTSNTLFAEAVKGPLLSSDSKVQIGTLDLVFYYLSQASDLQEQTRVFVEENIADYVFEILRLSESKDPLVHSCLQVLDLLSTAEQAFRPRLAIGFATLLPILRYIAEIPFHPSQNQMLKLLQKCVTGCPVVMSSSCMEEVSVILTKMFAQHTDVGLGMHLEAFNMACSIFVALIKSPSSLESSNMAISLQQASKDAVLACVSTFSKFPTQFLHSMYLLKEAYAYGCLGNSNNLGIAELRCCVLDVCKMHLLPFLTMAADEMEEEIVLGVFETFHSILLMEFNHKAMEFAGILVSSSWFSLAFGCLGLFPSEKMKLRVYLMLSSIVDVLLRNDSGQIIRDAVSYLPSDPIELLFLLGQRSSQNPELLVCQSSVLLILEISSLYGARPADEKLILASLEQFILVNGDLLCGLADSVPLTRVVNLYGLYRDLAKNSHHISYSSEAEKALFQLMVVMDWDFFSAPFHATAMKWLFQQEMTINPLSCQVLKFCRIISSGARDIDVRAIAELVAAGDNHGAAIFMSLLQRLLGEEAQKHDIMSVLKVLATIIDLIPSASDHLCLHRMGSTVLSLVLQLNHFSFHESHMDVLLLIFNVLRSVNPEMIHDGEAWSMVAMRLVDNPIHAVAATDSSAQEALLGIGILCLILHHSTNAPSLTEAAKAILINTSLASVVQNTVDAGSSGSREASLFMLLLHYFSLRSSRAVLPGVMEWRHFFNPSTETPPVSQTAIPLHALCRLMHFGPPPVKLVSSYCILEALTSMSQNREDKNHDCCAEYVMSAMGVLEGLVFHSHHRVALNCGISLSLILSWGGEPGWQRVVGGSINGWCRLILEELAVSLAIPCLVSKSFGEHHKPAVHVAVALLRLGTVPGWMGSVFDHDCLSGIIGNISPGNVTQEIVLLFRELLKSRFLKIDHTAKLNRILQASRKRMYNGNAPMERREWCTPDSTAEVCDILISFMSSESLDRSCGEGLIEEIELFFTSQTEDSGSQGTRSNSVF